MNQRTKWLSLAAALLLPQLMGGIGAAATASSVNTWYRRLRKPDWTPPSKVFPIVWTTLYAMMGVASWLVFRHGEQDPRRKAQAQQALGVYGAQLALNSLWSVLFFGLRRVDLALGEIGLLWTAILNTLLRFYRLNPVAGWLLVPYQAWTTFAALLNAGILERNR